MSTPEIPKEAADLERAVSGLREAVDQKNMPDVELRIEILRKALHAAIDAGVDGAIGKTNTALVMMAGDPFEKEGDELEIYKHLWGTQEGFAQLIEVNPDDRRITKGFLDIIFKIARERKPYDEAGE